VKAEGRSAVGAKNGANWASVYVVRSFLGLYLRGAGGVSAYTYRPGEAVTFHDLTSAEGYLEGQIPAARRLDYAVYERAPGGEEVLVR
jgi:hypothetical protein